ncbi:MAG: hypothetical protein ACRDJ4_14545 [Actinomycetota bacterium]
MTLRLLRVLTAALTAAVLVMPALPASAASIVFRGAATNTSAGTSVTVTRPPNVAQGDVLVAGVALHEQVNDPINAPAGWNLFRTDLVPGDIRLSVYIHVAGAGEPASYPWSSGDNDMNVLITAYGGLSTSNPVVASASEPDGSADRRIVAPSLPVPVSGSMLVMFAMIEGPTPNRIRPPSGFTERAERARHPGIECSDMVFPSPGDTGPKVARARHAADHIGTILALRAA